MLFGCGRIWLVTRRLDRTKHFGSCLNGASVIYESPIYWSGKEMGMNFSREERHAGWGMGGGSSRLARGT